MVDTEQESQGERGEEMGRNDGGMEKRRDPSGVKGVLACSALRRSYRNILMGRGTGGGEATCSSHAVLILLVHVSAATTRELHAMGWLGLRYMQHSSWAAMMAPVLLCRCEQLVCAGASGGE